METFNRPKFLEEALEWLLIPGKKNKNRYKQDGTGRPRFFRTRRLKGCANVQWLERMMLYPHSLPSEWVDAFMTRGFDKKGNIVGSLVHQWNTWTNAKAILANVGLDEQNSRWDPFTVKEIKQYLGLFILNGLSVSPRIEYKFSPQYVDPINGYDLCAGIFGRNAVRRLRQFKSLFAIQDPLLPIPSRSNAPNHKIDPFLKHLATVSLEAFDVGADISGDEKVASFQGRHADKAQVTFKRQGMGF